MKETIHTCGIYLYDQTTDKFLVCHATKSYWHMWSIPKGLKDKGEDNYTAACRELKEETGISVEELHIVKLEALEPVSYKKQKKILHAYLLVTDTPLKDHLLHCESRTRHGYPEIDGWKWIEPAGLLTHVHEAQRVNYDAIVRLLND